MDIAYYILASIIFITSSLSFIDHPHWTFRMFEFAKVHLLSIQLITFVLAFVLLDLNLIMWVAQVFIGILVVVNTSILIKYSPLYKSLPAKKSDHHSKPISLLSANVYQFNTDYQSFIELIQEQNPDIILTIESNKDWENALKVLEKDYPNSQKIALENTYGLHLYTRLKMKDVKTHYFVADDIPSIEAQLQTDDGFNFTFFGVHPPPPSPTEEENSKERDGELMCVAKKVCKLEGAAVVVGDFNSVAWSKVSTLFRKASELVDPRIGRGLISTFHANYLLLRFPIDQMFHSTDIFIEDFTVLRKFGSDHLPLFSRFSINNGVNKQAPEELEESEKEEVEELIEEGKKENGDREAVASE